MELVVEEVLAWAANPYEESLRGQAVCDSAMPLSGHETPKRSERRRSNLATGLCYFNSSW